MEREVERRVDPRAAGATVEIGQPLLDLLLDVVDEVGRALARPHVRLDAHRLAPGLSVIGLTDATEASLGTNPAVRSDGRSTLEAFLFDFSGDLYGRRLTVEFVKKLRDEADFASLDELAAQIRRDCDAARDFFRAAET